MKKFKTITIITMCFMFCFILINPVRTYACSELVSSLQPTNPAKYPVSSEWEPAFIGYRNSAKKAKKTYTTVTDWKTIHTEYLYKTSKTKDRKNKSVTNYTKYKRTHLEKYRTHYTKGSKKYCKEERIKVTLSVVGKTNKKPSSPYKKW